MTNIKRCILMGRPKINFTVELRKVMFLNAFFQFVWHSTKQFPCKHKYLQILNIFSATSISCFYFCYIFIFFPKNLLWLCNYIWTKTSIHFYLQISWCNFRFNCFQCFHKSFRMEQLKKIQITIYFQNRKKSCLLTVSIIPWDCLVFKNFSFSEI